MFSQMTHGTLAPATLSFILGRDPGGHWIVQESHGRCGGLFASKDDALRYARAECAEHASTLRIVSEPIELDFSKQH